MGIKNPIVFNAKEFKDFGDMRLCSRTMPPTVESFSVLKIRETKNKTEL